MICPKCKRHNYFVKQSNGNVVVCRKCGYKGEYVDPSYQGYHQGRYGYTLVRNADNDPMLRKMAEEKFVKMGVPVLDYGCGAGDYTNFISKITKNVVGADISTKIAEKRFPELKFKKINIAKKMLPFENNSFEVVVAVNVIEHVHDFENLLTEFKRILKSNGTIFITTYDVNFILHRILNDPTHVYEWTEVEFTKLIDNKFKIIKSFKYGSFFNFYPWNKLIVKFLKPELCVIARKI